MNENKGKIEDIKMMSEYLKNKGIDISVFDINDFIEEDDKIKILIDGWITIKKM